MGKEKYLKIVEGLFKKSPVVNYPSIERIVRNKGYTKQLVRNLVLKGRIKKLTKGFYTLHDNSQLAVFCFKPAYLGLQDALSFHDLWEQETIPVVITAQNARPGIRNVLGANVLVRRISKKYFFGFEYVQHGSLYFPYTDIEKTFIDMLYFNENLSEEAIEKIIRKINLKKLNSYLIHYPKRFRKIVLGCLERQKAIQ